METKASYILSTYSFLSTHSLDELLNVGYKQLNGNPIPSFDEKLLIDLCSEAQEIFENEETILNIHDDLVIIGDIHGSFHDLLRILKYIVPFESKVLFLGDYVDRGNFSLECITLLFSLKVLYPDMIYLLRGNHEFDSVCSQYGFKNEILNRNNKSQTDQELFENDNCYKYTKSLYKAFIRAFSYLPIGAIVNQTTFCIHGGLSPELHLIGEINRKIKRPINNFEDYPLLADLVWSDPSNFSEYPYEQSPRGYGYLFNQEATVNFIKENSIKRIVRGHQCVLNGVNQNFDKKCITVFSVSSYSKIMGNNSGIIKLFKNDDSLKVTTFPPIYHISKSDAYFYKVRPLNPDEEPKNHMCFNLLHPRLILQKPSFVMPDEGPKRIPLRRRKTGLPSCTPKFVTNSRKTFPYLKHSVQTHQQNCSD